ncbi:MAG: hypothetical protein ACRD4R_13645 [Candidatus Acidiferrales bacterium]
MKCPAVVLGVILFAATVSAQSNLNGPRLPAAPAPAAMESFPSQPAPQLELFAEALPVSSSAASTAAAPASSDADAAQGPIVVRPFYDWELYAGYSFFNFYEVPNVKNVENGFDVAVTYFPGGGWIGGEGDLMATFGSQLGCTSKFTLASGGARIRWAGRRGTQFWLHGLLGGTHYFPQTAYGGQNAFGYEMGGGVDISAHHRRMAYRFEADAVGTRFFGSYQYSPKISAGIVFKF